MPKPGANEIRIIGLTPTADESSIKVDGKGLATITDMMVELIPNPNNYEDVYPESDDEGEDSDDDYSESEPDSDATKALAEKKKQNDDSTMEANEEKEAAASLLAMLESYGRSFENDRPGDLKDCMNSYREERKKAFEAHKESEDKIEALEKERVKILKQQAKESEILVKEKEKATKEKWRRLEKKQKLRQEKLAARSLLKDGRVQFWPRNVYRVVLSLDTNFDMTPTSSRRGSIDSLAKISSESQSSDPCQISLSLSYITHSAYWAPRYDLSLTTTTSTGLILYRAEFCNTTSETWKDAQVILSTSQTAFQGLGEPIPTMLPWHIRLSKGSSGIDDGTSGALMSSYEMANRREGPMNVASKNIEPRIVLFGLDGVPFFAQQATFKGQQQAMENVQRTHRMQQTYMQQQQHQNTHPQFRQKSAFVAPGALFGNSDSSNSGLFGSSGAGIPLQQLELKNNSINPMMMAPQEQDIISGAGGYGGDFDILESFQPELHTLGTQESEWTESVRDS